MVSDKGTPAAQALLTTNAVAELLHVHPKHVYRLLRRGLPAHRLGGEWRFEKEEVLQWARSTGAAAAPSPRITDAKSSVAAPVDARDSAPRREEPPPLIAANGDICVETLLLAVREGGEATLGLVLADRSEASALVAAGRVLAAGVHGSGGGADGRQMVRIHVVRRVIGLAFAKKRRLRDITDLARLRLASRPTTAGVRTHLDNTLRKEGLDPGETHQGALLLDSHRDVVLAVASGQADVGLVTLAWAHRAGLDCFPLAEEDYDLSVRADSLTGEPCRALVRALQNPDVRRKLATGAGYTVRDTGSLRL